MIIERNGVVFFPTDEDYSDHPAFQALKSVSLGDVRLPNGFFLKEEQGKQYVLPATREEREAMILKAFPHTSREALDSFCLPSLSDDHKCDNIECFKLKPHHICMKGFDGAVHQYGCACVLIE
jgi:hypothetical protein